MHLFVGNSGGLKNRMEEAEVKFDPNKMADEGGGGYKGIGFRNITQCHDGGKIDYYVQFTYSTSASKRRVSCQNTGAWRNEEPPSLCPRTGPVAGYQVD